MNAKQIKSAGEKAAAKNIYIYIKNNAGASKQAEGMVQNLPVSTLATQLLVQIYIYSHTRLDSIFQD